MHIIVCYILVCNEWTELNGTGEAAPEELEEHSMVAHEVQPLIIFCCFDLSANITPLGVLRMCFTALTFFRASCMCLEACWILHTASGGVPSGCLTLVSFTVETTGTTDIGSQCYDFVCKCSDLTDACCVMSVPVSRLQGPVKIFSTVVQLSAKPVNAFMSFKKCVSQTLDYSQKDISECLSKKENSQKIFT